ncbi:MAG TPA: hypothetical protein VHG29_09155 [Novosphingobium sp.]|nr:hypothetical protein [Novosphingobium sp.]
MQSATDQQGLTRLLEMVRGKMGKVVDTRREGWRSNFNTAGSTIELVMSTRFEHGSGKEDFVFASGGATLKLSGYHISSPDLIEEQPTASPRSPGRRRPGLPRG